MAVWPSGNGVQNQTAGIGYTWVAPAGVTKLTVELWGSGAGGDGGLLANVNGGWGGGGGGERSVGAGDGGAVSAAGDAERA